MNRRVSISPGRSPAMNRRPMEVPVAIRYTEYSRAKGQRSIGAAKIAFDYLFEKLFQ